MNFPIMFFESSERLAENGDGFFCPAFRDQILAENRHVVSRLRMILSIPGSHDARRRSLKTLGLRVMAPLILNVSEVREVLRNVGIAIAVDLLVHLERAFVQVLRNVIVTEVVVRVCELAKRGRKIGGNAPGGRLKTHGLFESGDGFVVLAAIIENAAEGKCGSRNDWMIRS